MHDEKNNINTKGGIKDFIVLFCLEAHITYAHLYLLFLHNF